MRKDDYFSGPSPLESSNGICSRSSAGQPVELLDKLKQVRSAVLGVRAAMATAIKHTPSLEDMNTALLAALCTDPSRLPGTSPTRKAIEDFQSLVPVVKPTTLNALIIAPDTGAETLRGKIDEFEAGEITEEWFGQLVHGVAKHAGIAPGKGDLREQAAVVISKLEAKAGQGADFAPRGEGCESRVFTARNGMVYKVTPIRHAVLDIPAITNAEPLYPRLASFPLVGPGNGCPLLDRMIHMAQTPDMALADIVGITEDQKVIFKQVDLGYIEPSMDLIADWAQGVQGNTLSVQADDPKGELNNDTSMMPVVALVGGRPVLMLDVNPRNCRLVNGIAVPFDLVSRELTDAEVKAHPEIRQAVADLTRKPVRRELTAPRAGRRHGIEVQ